MNVSIDIHCTVFAYKHGPAYPFATADLTKDWVI